MGTEGGTWRDEHWVLYVGKLSSNKKIKQTNKLMFGMFSVSILSLIPSRDHHRGEQFSEGMGIITMDFLKKEIAPRTEA